MKISVCIPMYNENSVIANTATVLSAYMEENFTDYEILFYSDGSTDGCDETVRTLNLPRVKVISNPVNRGKGYSVRAAMREADGDIRLFTDADLAYGTDVIRQIADAFEKDPQAELVIGSRNLRKDGYAGYTFLRKLASKIYIRILCLAGGFRLSDSQCGCKAFSKKVVETIFPRCEVDRFAFDFEIILWAVKYGYPIREVPVRVITHGDSKVRIVRDTFRMLQDLRRMRRKIKKAKI